MFFTYLRKELFKRKKQTAIISIGIALAITLVVVMSAVSNGISASQTKALQAVYGVGTDLTVTKATSTASNTTGQQFKFGSGSGSTSDNGTTRNLSQSSLHTSMGTTAYSSSALTTVKNTADVSAATGILLLQNNSFSGQIANQSGNSGYQPGQRTSSTTAPTGGPDGNGGSSFSVSNFSVAGIEATTTVGPMSSVTLKSGRLLTASDATAKVAVLDSNYATSADKKVGDSITIAGKSFKIVGIVASAASSTSSSVANVYIPLKVAQSLSSNSNKLTTIYVKAASASDITAIQTSLNKSLGSLTVNTQADLASTVTGAVSTASSIVNTFGFWIVIIALAAAFLLSILFTISGVSRRTRELGTLKSIGWKNSRIVRQITGESVAQGLIGGILGSLLGLAAIFIVNVIHPTITSAANTQAGRGFGPGASSAANPSSIDITAILTPEVIVYAFGIALIGGILAGVIGSWRAAHLRPVEALRSV